MTFRKVFEYGMAGVITGMIAPIIHKEYKELCCKKVKKLNMSVEDLMKAQDFDEEEDEDF